MNNNAKTRIGFWLTVALLFLLIFAAEGLDSYYISTFAGNGVGAASLDGVVAQGSPLKGVFGVWVYTGGVVYLSEGTNRKIRTVSGDGLLNTYAGSGNAGTTTQSSGPATSVGLANPTSVWGSGSTVYIGDISLNQVWSVSNGILSLFAGSGGTSYSVDGLPATATDIAAPRVSGDTLGNVYIAAGNNYRVLKIGSVVTTVAGTGVKASGADFGIATSTSMGFPTALALDTTGNIFVSDDYSLVRKVSSSGTMTTFLGYGSSTIDSDGRAATATGIYEVDGMWIDTGNNMYYTDTANLVKIILAPSTLVYTIAGTATTGAGGFGPATSCTMSSPAGIYGASPSLIYFGDNGNSMIRELSTAVTPTPLPTISKIPTVKPTSRLPSVIPTSAIPSVVPTLSPTMPTVTPSIIPTVIPSKQPTLLPSATPTVPPSINPSGFFLSTFAGSGVSGASADGSLAQSSPLMNPRGIWAASDGVVYFAESSNKKVRSVSTSGILGTLAGSGSSTGGVSGGPATSMGLVNPIALWGSGSTVYLGDFSGNMVWTVSGGVITLFAGSGSNVFTDGVAATSSGVASIFGICGDTNSNVYIALNGYRVLKVTSADAKVTSIAGTGTNTFSGDGGPASSAGLSYVYDVYLDTMGNIFAAEGVRIRKISTSGIISTYVGTDVCGLSTDGLAATSTNTYAVYGVWIDLSSNLFYAEPNANKIKIVTSTSSLVYTIAGNGNSSPSGAYGPATATGIASPYSLFGLSASSIYVEGNGVMIYAVTSSRQPSPYPSIVPSISPTLLPSRTPTLLPSLSPSNLPTLTPSLAPSALPTISSAPTIVTGYYLSTAAGNGVSAASADGVVAQGSPLLYSFGVWASIDGTVYIGESYNGKVRSISTTGILGTLAGSSAGGGSSGGPATSMSLSQPQSVWGIDSTVYIADVISNKVWSVTNGIITLFAGNGDTTLSNGIPATSTGISSPYSLCSDTLGNVYISSSSVARVFQVSNTILSTVAGTGIVAQSTDGAVATATNLGYVYSVFVDSTGNLFVSESYYRIRKISVSGIVITFLGTSNFGYPSDGLPATSTSIGGNGCMGMWIDSYYNVYYSDYAANKVKIVTTSVGIVYTIAGTGATGLYSFGPATSVALNHPVGVHGIVSSTIYFVDAFNFLLRELTTSVTPTPNPTVSLVPSCIPTRSPSIKPSVAPSIIPTIAPSRSPTLTPTSALPTISSAPTIVTNYYIATPAGNGLNAESLEGVVAQGASLMYSFGVWVATTGSVYIAETSGGKVKYVSTSGTLNTLAGSPIGGGPSGGPATSISLSAPQSVWGVGSTVYFADSVTNKVWSVTNGIATLFAGNGDTVFLGNGIPATSSAVYSPYSVGSDTQGNIYIASNAGARLMRTSNSILSTVAGTGTATKSTDGVMATSTTFGNLYSIAIDSTGNIFLFESTSNVKKISVSGIVSTFLGTGNNGDSTDGLPATSTSMYGCYGMWIDSYYNLYYTDWSRYYVKVVTSSSGNVYTVAGTGLTGPSGNYGPATSVLLRSPAGIHGIASSNIYFVDAYNYMLRTLSSSVTPTPNPTVSSVPTTTVTISPTTRPTLGPSAIPTCSPSKLPTVSPSLLPTVAPTVSNIPTLIPTVSFPPSLVPTLNPSLLPSMSPTKSPSVCPTTLMPSVSPTTSSPSMNPSGFYIFPVVGSGTLGASNDGGIAQEASLMSVYGVWAATEGSVYVTEAANFKVRSVSSSGILGTFAGTGSGSGGGFSGDAATSMTLNNPKCVWGSGDTVYVTDAGFNKVWSVNGGIMSLFAGNGGGTWVDGVRATSNGISSPFGIFGDASGSVYICSYGAARVLKVSNGNLELTAGTGDNGQSIDGGKATASVLGNVYTLSVDSVGSVFVCELFYRIRKIADGIITTLVGTGESNSSDDGLGATATPIGHSYGVWADTLGNVYYSDSSAQKIKIVTVSSGIVYTVAGTGASGLDSSIDRATAAVLNYPNGMYGTSVADIYFGDSNSYMIRRLSTSALPTLSPTATPTVSSCPSVRPTTGTPSIAPSINPTGYFISTLAGNGVSGFSADGVTAQGSSLASLYSLWAATDGVVYLTDQGALKIRMVSVTGILGTCAGSGTSSGGSSGIAATSYGFNSPNAVWGVGDTVFLSDGVYRIWSVTNGIASWFAGNGNSGTATNGFAATASPIFAPNGIGGDTAGNVYLALKNGCQVVKVSNSILKFIAGIGDLGQSSDGVVASSAALGYCLAVFADTVGNVFLSESFFRIRKVSVSGIITTVVGTATSATSADGLTATSTSLSGYSQGVWIDSMYNLFYSDYSPHKVKVVPVASSTVSTIAGIGSSSLSGNYGPASSAGLSSPAGLYGSSTSSVYIADTGNYMIRTLTTSLPPTPRPSNSPTAVPSVSILPTKVPTVSPTTIPTKLPTLVPSVSPTTTSPSVKPTTSAPSIFNSYYISTLAGNGVNAASMDGVVAQGSPLVQSYYGIWASTDGMVYFSEQSNYKVRTVNADGILGTLAGGGSTISSGVAATSSLLPSPLAIWGSSSGTVYIGDRNSNQLFSVTNGIITLMGGSGSASFVGNGVPVTSSNFYNPMGVCGDTLGSLYVSLNAGSRVLKISNSLVTTYTGTGSINYGGDGVKASSASIGTLNGIFTDTGGNVFYSETDSYYRIRKVSSSGILTTFVGTGASGTSTDGLPATSTTLMGVLGVWIDTSNNFYFADYNGGRVRTVSSSGIVYTIAGTGIYSGTASGNYGPALSATMNGPSYLYGTSTSVIYVGDQYNEMIRTLTVGVTPTPYPTMSIVPTIVPTVKPTAFPTAPSVFPTINPTSAAPSTASPSIFNSYYISTLAGNGVNAASPDGVTAQGSSLIQSYYGIWAATDGVVYVGENAKVRSVSTSGILGTLAGGGSGSVSGSAATSVSLTQPLGVWGSCNTVCTVYVSDRVSYLVWSVTNGIITLFGGTGGNSFLGNGLPATSSNFFNPLGVCGDTAGNIYVALGTGGRVLKVSNSIVTSVAGTGSLGFSSDGSTASSASLAYVNAIFVDTANNVYISEYFSTSRIRKLTSSGTFTTIVGSGTSYSNGIAATSTGIMSNYGFWVDTVKNFYYSDYNNGVVRTITSSASIVYTIAGTVSGTATGNYGLALSATMNGPTDVYGTSTSVIYVGDQYNVMIRTLAVGVPPTPNPTSSINPTVKPTVLPTVLPSTPSRSPSATPTIRPSVVPTVVPSMLPSLNPSLAPSIVPSIGPSAIPSCTPTEIPSQIPSIVPTLSPTLLPSTSISPTTVDPSTVPSCIPTVLPSLIPSVNPTTTPSVQLTVNPSCGPTMMPSLLPTVYPTVTPSTVLPTLCPSLTPTMSPTIQPSLIPTIAPSPCPSVLPSEKPSVIPSLLLSGTPSLLPTGTLSTAPTVVPSTFPSVGLSVVPSFQPTICPSTAVPSVSTIITPLPSAVSTVPTSLMSKVPSLAPTLLPSVTPSAFGVPPSLPSVGPTVAPSTIPSVQPSICPSSVPSVPTPLATTIPTSLLSSVPTLAPIQDPSVVSSTTPSGFPIKIAQSCRPSAFPSIVPSTEPSTVLILVPTVCPSISPSALPSIEPSAINPTVQPTVFPSLLPSLHPTVTPTTVRPTLAPSEAPTLLPSSSVPSVVPTDIPTTVQPTVDPSVLPSCQPTALPSIGPSLVPSVVPTLVPTTVPTIMPSALPTLGPSVVPTLSPTRLPTVNPSAVPSRDPSFSPTLLSSAPTLTRLPTAPTQKPTVIPSIKPSLMPVVAPTIKPTQLPSTFPSLKPSRSPSLSPSLKPTNVPSVKPSAKPSVTASARPTHAPTMPTITPSLSQPSISPSPTVLPSLSCSPTSSPVCAPSITPTPAPTAKPTTDRPSQAPTVAPTIEPTVVPTVTPTVLPTTTVPTLVPTSLEFFASHPKATLPNNQSISVIGPSSLTFKIVMPFLTMSSGPFGTVYSNIVLTEGDESLFSYVISGSATLASTSVDQADRYSGSAALDSSKRSASVLPDINGDGFDDLIIGDGYSSRCYVLLGTKNGLTNMTVGFTVFGESEGDLTGWSVSGAGDVNNDTLADFIVGAPFARGTGAFYVVYGRRFNNFDVYLGNFSASHGFAMYGALKSDYLGISVSNAGDVNGDGCDDVVVGAVMTSQYFAGAAYIVYGGRSLRTLTSISQLIPLQGYKLSGVSYGYYGYSVSGSGDVNKDGLDDVLIGSSPQKSTLTLTAYLVYGSKSIPGDVSLNSLTTSQGIRISGGGVTVSYAGDIHDGFADIMVGGNLGASTVIAGYVVYSNATFMTKLTSQPSIIPTVLPVFAPTRAPTRIPTRVPLAPTVIPSRMPSLVPSAWPTAPTDAPTPGVSQPSSWPSSLPTHPTIAPSAAPSEVPTVSPSQSPTEAPTKHPTETPSESPTVFPTLEPSEIPSMAPSGAPTSPAPTDVTMTHSPVEVPTRLPTVETTLPEYTTYLIQGAVVVNNQSTGRQNYIVNTSESVSIYNLMGDNLYTISPWAGSKLTIVCLNATSDVIDLTSFSSITDFKQLQITEGSVILTLPNLQIIHILNLHPKDISATNFVFYSGSSTPSDKRDDGTLPSVAAALLAAGGFIFGSMLLLRLCGGLTWLRTGAAVLGPNKFMIEVKYNAKDGELVDEIKANSSSEDDDDSDDIEVGREAHSEVTEEFESIAGSVLLSDHTLNSEGEFVYRKTSKDQSIASFNSSAVLSEFSINSEGDFVDKYM